MDPATIGNFEILFSKVVSVLIAAGAAALFIMLVTAGFKYLTSAGDPKALEGAKKTLTYAIGGFVVLVFSFLVIKIIETFTGLDTSVTNITNFKVVK